MPCIIVKKPKAGRIWSTPTKSVTRTDKLELKTPEKEECIHDNKKFSYRNYILTIYSTSSMKILKIIRNYQEDRTKAATLIKIIKKITLYLYVLKRTNSLKN